MNTKLTVLTLLVLCTTVFAFGQNVVKTSTNHRILTMSREVSAITKMNKVFVKEINSAQKSNYQDKQSPYSLLGKDFYYIAGKPTWAYPYDKIIHKPLSNISPSLKNNHSFQGRLFEVKETTFQADIEAKVYFQSGEHTLANRNQIQFQNLLKVIHETLSEHEEAHPEESVKVWVEIQGFTDSRPFYANQPVKERQSSNLKLSEQRADQVATYLKVDLQKRVYNLSIQSKGMGEALPPHAYQSSIDDSQRRLCVVIVHFSPIDNPSESNLITEDDTLVIVGE
jgi:outer membrane protein OmpA-like peptidoglycan-associated protein